MPWRELSGQRPRLFAFAPAPIFSTRWCWAAQGAALELPLGIYPAGGGVLYWRGEYYPPMDLWGKRWRMVEQRATFVIYCGMDLVAEVRRRSPGGRANATIVVQLPELLDCALSLLDGAEHDRVNAADLNRAVALLDSLPPVTGKRWRARGRSVLATWNRRCFRIARVQEPNMAAAVARIPDLLETLTYLRDTRQSEPVCQVEVNALSAVEQQARLCFTSVLEAPHPRHRSSAFHVGRGFARPGLQAGLADRWHDQLGGPPAGSTAPEPGARFGPRKANGGGATEMSA